MSLASRRTSRGSSLTGPGKRENRLGAAEPPGPALTCLDTICQSDQNRPFYAGCLLAADEYNGETFNTMRDCRCSALLAFYLVAPLLAGAAEFDPEVTRIVRHIPRTEADLAAMHAWPRRPGVRSDRGWAAARSRRLQRTGDSSPGRCARWLVATDGAGRQPPQRALVRHGDDTRRPA